MIKWLDVGVEAEGFVAVGQHAVGVIAIGQVATGVVAIGQLARGVIVVGQLAAGIIVLGQLSLGVAWSAGMVGIGATSPGWLVLPLLGGSRGSRVDLVSGPRLVVGLVVLVGLAAAWWLGVGQELVDVLLGDDGILQPERQLR
jgi:hypothetical protein